MANNTFNVQKSVALQPPSHPMRYFLAVPGILADLYTRIPDINHTEMSAAGSQASLDWWDGGGGGGEGGELRG